MTRIQLERFVFLLASLTLILYPFIYWGYYAGDATIHLVFGKNASIGHFFEFNFGEKTSGESSVGYMLFLGLLYSIIPSMVVPIAVKIIDYFAWLSFLYIFYRILEDKKIEKLIIAASVLALGLLPGSVYNSMNGMENILFGLFIISWFYFATQFSYFKLDFLSAKNTIGLEIIFSFLMGLGAWLRVEIIPFFMMALLTRFVACLYYKKPIKNIIPRLVTALTAFILPVIALFFFIHYETGMWIQSSVIARTLQGKIMSHHFGPLIFDPKILTRLLIYFPITIFWLYGIIRFFEKKWENQIDEFFAITVFLAYIGLFTCVTGIGQLGRYMIFLTPFWLLIAARGLEQSYQLSFNHKRAFASIAVIFSLALVGIYTKETSERLKLGNNRDFIAMIKSPQNIKNFSDQLYAKFGSPKDLPISIATGEVDIRYYLDNRFIIRCLDGRIDPIMLKYFLSSSVDYIGYMKERHVNYVMADFVLPGNTHLEVSNLRKMKTGEFIEIEKMKFTSITNDYYKVDII